MFDSGVFCFCPKWAAKMENPCGVFLKNSIVSAISDASLTAEGVIIYSH